METIDSSFELFKKILEEIKDYGGTIFSEQDTKVKIIDRLFTEVLGWNYSDFKTEEQAGEGFIDYKFSINDLS